MRATTKAGRALGASAALVLLASACAAGGAESESESEAGDVNVCELAYYTGDFGPYGKSLTADVVFPVDEVINDDPPLGRTWKLFHEDLGTVGEAQAARTCMDRHDADIMVSIAHGYRTYRDLMMERWEEEDGPIVPSVHGGAIPGNLGGKAAEPIFRAQGLDETLGMSGMLYADEIDAQDVVIFATNVEGFQLAADAAERTADELGIEVLERIDAPAEQASYVAEAQRIADLEPDVVIVQAGPIESATLIKQATEAGISLEWVGETGWIQPEFSKTLGEAPLAAQKGVGFAAFSYNEDSPRLGLLLQTVERDSRVRRRVRASERRLPLLDLRPDGADRSGRGGRRLLQGQRLGPGHARGRGGPRRAVQHLRGLPRAGPCR